MRAFETTLADHGRVRSPTGSLPNIPETARVLKIACPGNRRDLVNAILGVVRAHARQSEGTEAVAVEAGIGPHVEEENNDAELEPLQEPQNTETHVHIGNPVGRTRSLEKRERCISVLQKTFKNGEVQLQGKANARMNHALCGTESTPSVCNSS